VIHDLKTRLASEEINSGEIDEVVIAQAALQPAHDVEQVFPAHHRRVVTALAVRRHDGAGKLR
jgi:hypothetical protein